MLKESAPDSGDSVLSESLTSTKVPITTEIIPKDAVKRAKEAVENTLEGADCTHISTALRASTKTLPQYQQLKEPLANVSKQALPEALFEELKGMQSKPTAEESSEDGVLISSMKQGSLCCAGRVLLASTFLQEKGISHSIISTVAGEGGHSVILIEVDDGTSAYCDAENGLYFTFPTDALEQREGNNTVSMNYLKDFTPRSTDVYHGLGSISRTFMKMDEDTGITYQYLGNVQAALSGNKEFEKSGILVDELAAKGIAVLQREHVGTNIDLIERFGEELYEKGIPRQIERDGEMRQLVKDVYDASNGKEEQFCTFMERMFVSHQVINSLFPYLQHASEEQRRLAAMKMWQMMQSRG